MIKRILIFGFAAAIMFTSCGSDSKVEKLDNNKASGEEELGLIKSDVHSDSETLLGSMPQYSLEAPGTAEKIERAFENAPPMIPHMTEGFFPITRTNNICLTCHMPDKVEETGAVALPVSHFTDYRPQVIKIGELYKVDAEEGEVIAKKLNNLSHTRFHCSQCHVPQANVTVDIKNTFDRVFRNDASKTTSNLQENIGEGVK